MKINFLSSIIIMLSFLSTISYGQSSGKAYKKLSSAEKCWVLFHPFKAKRAYRETKEVQKIVDSIKKGGDLGTHYIGNQLDAFKHAFWMWSLAEKIGFRSARSLGRQHEKGNKQYYKDHKLEDGVTPDRISSEMDLFNNAVGIALYKRYRRDHLTKSQRIKIIKEAVLKGEMRMIFQTYSGRYLDNAGRIIPKEKYNGLWDNNKCLVPSTSLFLIADNKSK